MKISKLFRISLILAAATIFLFPLIPNITLGVARADSIGVTFNVNSNGDAGDAHPGDGVCATQGGVCTLRAAIDETNMLTGPNTINIPAITIALNSDLKIFDHVGDDSVHIFGAGINLTILDGNNAARAFYFEARSGNHSISNLTIRNANNKSSSLADTTVRDGGGIYNEAILTLSNVTITNSKAFMGGGIYNQLAFVGSAGENIPTLTLNSVTLTNNAATATQVGFGGGGLFNGSVLNGHDVTITGNHAEMQGAGYYNNSAKIAQLTDFVISNNTSHFGSGIDNDFGEIVLENGTISGNTSNCCGGDGEATGGAGIYNNQGTMQLTNIMISNNVATSAGGYGGGIYNAEKMYLKNVSITNNKADYGAGIINGNYFSGSNELNLINATISNNIGYGTKIIDSEGGGIFNIDNGHTTIYYSTITNNQADVGGGITNRTANTQIVLKNTILAGNIDTWGATDCRGEIHSLGYNLIGNSIGNPTYGFACIFFNYEGDILNSIPMLGMLVQDEHVAYYPLNTNSPAIDSGSIVDCPPSDVRGYHRPSGNSCDMGSYEAELEIPNLTYKIFAPIVIR